MTERDSPQAPVCIVNLWTSMKDPIFFVNGFMTVQFPPALSTRHATVRQKQRLDSPAIIC